MSLSTNNNQDDFELRQGNLLKTSKDLYIKEVFGVSNTETQFKKGQRIHQRSVRGAVNTLTTDDFLVGISALAVATSIGLPHPNRVGPGKTFIVKDEIGGAGTTNVTITSDGEKNIDGSSSTTLSTNYQAKRFYTDGSNWFTC